MEDRIKQGEAKIEAIDQTLYDFEESIAKSFAAQGPLLAEPVAQKAMSTNRFPTFPFYMTVSYLDLIKQEDKPLQIEKWINSFQEGINYIQSYVNSQIDLSYSGPRSQMEKAEQDFHKMTSDTQSLLSHIENLLQQHQ